MNDETTPTDAVTMHCIDGTPFLVDREDEELARSRRWSVAPRRPLYGATRYVRSTHPQQYIHRLIMGAAPGQRVDHRNRDGFDNRRSNLRFTTPQLNAANMATTRRGGSSFKGVTWYARDRRWRARIVVDGVESHLGYFGNESDAARAYDVAALLAWGEHANLNEVTP